MQKTTTTPLSDKYWAIYGKEITEFCTALMGNEFEGFMQSNYAYSALQKMENEDWLKTEPAVRLFLYTTAKNRCLQRRAWLNVYPDAKDAVQKSTFLKKAISFIKQSIAKYYA